METYYLIELGPTQTGTVIRTQEMTAEQATATNAKMLTIKWVSGSDLKTEQAKARRAQGRSR